MKKHVYILLVLCLALSSCGMTDVWKEWENEGIMSEERLRPSEVKALMCAVDGWKMVYEGTSFYFQFTEGGSLISDSDESMLQSEVETNYYLDYEGEKKVLLTVQGKGMLQYLEENSEETFVITSYSNEQITAQGKENGKTMILTPVTATEMQQVKESKRLAVIAYNKAQSLELLKTSLSNGIFRNVSSKSFVAHYAISCDDDDNWKIRISSIDSKVLKHTEYLMNVSTASDEKATLSIVGGLTINGMSFDAIYYGYDTGELSTSNANVLVDLNRSSDMVSTYTGSWSTHVVDRDYICDAFPDLLSQLEFDDRTPRHIVVCPGSTSEGQWHYVFFTVTAKADDVTGRVYLTNPGTELLFGGYGNDVALAQANFEIFLNFCFSEEGLWMYQDSDSYVYVISPTSDYWFRMK